VGPEAGAAAAETEAGSEVVGSWPSADADGLGVFDVDGVLVSDGVGLPVSLDGGGVVGSASR